MELHAIGGIDRSKIASEAYSLWTQIGHDVLACAKASSLKKDEVIEILLDGGKLEMHLRENGEWTEVMNDLDNDDLENILSSSSEFSSDVYGL